ncbi:unnamed protein product [Amoebophrya sp. A120]|nr:unnamed protein product [Amoebophrya sp. A120]|eukprot:GSA120T00005366001.1
MEFVKKNQFTEAADCLICLETIKDKVFTASCCAKAFCEDCRDECSSMDCPACRAKKSDGFTIVPNRFIEMNIDNEKVRCKGCKKTMTRKQFREDHIKTNYWEECEPCAETKRSCPHSYAGCKFEGKLAKLRKHLGCECEHGYRKLDASAIAICGGEAGLKKSVQYIESHLHLNPPTPPETLGQLMHAAGINLTSRVVQALAGGECWDEIPDRLSLENSFIEYEEGRRAAGRRDWVDNIKHITTYIFAHSVRGTSEDARSELWDGYHKHLLLRVVDTYNNEDWDDRDTPSDIDVKPCPEKGEDDWRDEWRKVFGWLKKPSAGRNNDRSRSPRRQNGHAGESGG